MAGQIRMTPEQMRTRAKAFRGEGQKVEDTIKKMQSLINTLKGEWEGQASKEFEQQFNTLKPSFTKMRELVEDISKQLESTAQAVEQMDKDIASKFKI
jgi:WXG100 family type VII secretion target